MVQVLLWMAVLLLLHTYFFYPLLLVASDRVRTFFHARVSAPAASLAPGPSALGEWPRVSLVVAAYNEASCIAEKVHNSLALDYPADRFQLLIGSDGSTDGTDDLVRAAQDPRVVLSRAERAGKASVLNRCIPQASGDIIVLSDANTVIDRDALKRLVSHFDDPNVGAVCGKLKLYNPRIQDYEESAYWAYESMIKLYEGRRGAVMGANGGLYAIRRRLFRPLSALTITDDFVIPLRIVKRGYRFTYEPNAIASEETAEDYDKEFGRRARIAAGNFQSLSFLKELLSPSQGFAAYAFWSHKVLRWCAPALMVLAFVANLFLLDSRFYQMTLGLQLTFYALALLGRSRRLSGPFRRVTSVAYYFVVMNAAMAVGFWRYLRNTQRPAWDRTARA
ncbi:MAG TPA: glycosyltransferase family 2 protein [Myxococcaceae bacterium]|nr:glycosyltransferase family 2 protein [Myxococcaceae bacterium]